nr:cilia- and flagella-associated protein 251-like [Penaeus vannamei]
MTSGEGEDKGAGVQEGLGEHRPTRGRVSRGKYRGQGRYIDPELNAQKHEEEIMAELDPDAVFGRRRIEGHGDSFTISVSNTTHSSAGEKEPEVLGKFVRVGSGRMGQGKRSPPQNEHGGGDERGEGERPHYHGRGRGQRHARGRGRGQGRGYFNNKENSPYTWVRPSGAPAQTSSFAVSSQKSMEQDASDAPIPVAASESKADNNAIKPGAEKIVESNLKPDTNQEGNTIDENSQIESKEKGESGLLQEEIGENFEGSEDAAKEEELDDYEDEEVYEEAEEEYYEEDYHEAEEEELKGEEEETEEDLGATEIKENLPAEVESAPIQREEGKVEEEDSKQDSKARTDKEDHEPESQPVPVDVPEAEKQNTDENEGKEKETLDVKSEPKECAIQSEQELVSKDESPGKNNEQDVKENTEQEGECPRVADGEAVSEAAGKDKAGDEEKESSIVEDNAETEECPIEVGKEVSADDDITIDEEGTSVEKESDSKSNKDEDAQIENQPKDAASELPEPESGKERPSKLEVSEGKGEDSTAVGAAAISSEAAEPQAGVKVSESEKKTEGLVKLTPSPTKTNEGEKKPESRLTPSSSPTKTEELVRNIEWK